MLTTTTPTKFVVHRRYRHPLPGDGIRNWKMQYEFKMGNKGVHSSDDVA